MRIVPVILVAIGLLTIPLIWFAAQSLIGERDSYDPGATGAAIDSGARIEIEGLRQQIEALQGQIQALQEQIQSLATRPSPGPRQDGGGLPLDQGFIADGENAILDAYAQVVLIANRRKVNAGITVGGPRFLEQFLGRPRENLSNTCEAMTNPKLKDLLKVADVGPIRVQMLQPAIDSLTRVFEKVRATDPDLYARINTAGSLCVRQIRGTVGRTSTHSFGLAVDLNIDGHLDTLGDGKTQLGLTILADFFREEGWVWGAGFTREDSMHFEVSQQMLEEWRRQGIL
ncbi:M15 family metallopeptidase [Sulfitobacter sabulilitoris]|uniref:M15 family peptidase n=1 Tax=Sulfitobacter sabulilitoris TaxID=2562655 RepID=A0A5S3PIF9_9RHOB|nr:M15 family metallopeptidase [Sulfitobacter sabulilitoris]TMM54144.1 M15 family peptidase [Sulfitobacter sabulilitoris]